MENLVETFDAISEELFEDHLNSSEDPNWIKALKIQAWERFQTLPPPSEKNQHWRFSKPNILSQNTSPVASKKTDFCYDLPNSGKLIFEKNEIFDYYLKDELIKNGVIWCSIKDAIKQHEHLLDQYLFQNQETLGSEKWSAFHTAFFNNGAFLFIPDNLEINEPFYFEQNSSNVNFPHILIVLGKNAKAQFIDAYKGNGSIFSTFHTNLAEGSNFKRKTFQICEEDARLLRMESQNLAQYSKNENFFAEIGSAYSRCETKVLLKGSHSSTQIEGIIVKNDSHIADQRIEINHQEKFTTSTVSLKNILNDKAKTITHCKVKVPPHAQDSISKQKIDNLILSEDAIVHSLPELEIEANEVQCSHGATTGHLDEDQLFYLTSRGIDSTSAKELMAQGFCEDLLQKNCTPQEVELIRPLIYKKLSRVL